MILASSVFTNQPIKMTRLFGKMEDTQFYLIIYIWDIAFLAFMLTPSSGKMQVSFL